MINFTEILREFGENTVADIKTKMAQYGMGDSTLAKSVNYEIDGTEIKITAASYWPYAEKGRGPGGTPRNFEDVIATWAVSRGFRPNDLMKFARSVKWKTIRDGSYLYRHPSEQRDFETEAIQENIDWLKDHVGAFLVHEM